MGFHSLFRFLTHRNAAVSPRRLARLESGVMKRLKGREADALCFGNWAERRTYKYIDGQDDPACFRLGRVKF
jgi:hypothetical protein